MRRQGQRFVVGVQRLLKPAVVLQQQAEIGPCAGLRRIAFDGFPEHGDRRFRLAMRRQRHRQQIAGRRMIRVEAPRFGQPADGLLHPAGIVKKFAEQTLQGRIIGRQSVQGVKLGLD